MDAINGVSMMTFGVRSVLLMVKLLFPDKAKDVLTFWKLILVIMFFAESSWTRTPILVEIIWELARVMFCPLVIRIPTE